MGSWTVTVPEAGTNLVIDPECTALNFYNANGATVTVSTEYAHNGITCLKAVSNNAAADEGFYSDVLTGGMPVTVGTTYTLSGYLRGAGTVYLGIAWQNGATTFATATGATITLTNTGWTRYTVTGTAPATSVTAVLTIYTKTQQAATWYTDGLQFEAKSYATTFISGNQQGCRWVGLYNGSVSIRDAQYRLGGREVDLETTYGVKVIAPRGIGIPPVQNNLQNLALQPGAMFQSNKLMPRYIDLIVSTQISVPADSMTTLHTRRDSLIGLFSPSQYRGAQALRLGYTGAGRTVYGDYRYDGGLEFTDISGRNESIPLRLIAVDPLLYEDDQGQAIITMFTGLTSSNYAAARIAGAWQNLGTGFNGEIYAIEYDPRSGRVYFGGAFTSANGVACNRVCYWNGTTFVSMESGTQGTVRALALAPNGDLWVGGDFTQVGSSLAACRGLARYNYATNTWTAFNPAATFTSVFAISATADYTYVGGNFTNWDGIAAADYIARYDGSAWSALGAGMNDAVYCLTSYGTITFAGGKFTSAGGVASTSHIAYWQGSAWVNITSGCDNDVHAIARASNGVLYVGGKFTAAGGVTVAHVARWDGYSWSALGNGLNDNVYNFSDNGATLYALGKFTASGSVSMAGVAFWNGYVWTSLDYQVPTGAIAYASAFTNEGYLFIGHDTAGDSMTAAINTVTNASTTIAYPIITLYGITSAAVNCSLRFFENQTTGQIIYFNLRLLAGETITIDLSPNKKSITSDFRGRIYDNPLSNSDFGNFHLLPGSNVIACCTDIDSTIQGVMDWRIQHLSVDGVV